MQVIGLYIEEQRRSLQLPIQAARIIKGVSRGQMIAEVLDILCAHKPILPIYFNHCI